MGRRCLAGGAWSYGKSLGWATNLLLLSVVHLGGDQAQEAIKSLGVAAQAVLQSLVSYHLLPVLVIPRADRK